MYILVMGSKLVLAREAIVIVLAPWHGTGEFPGADTMLDGVVADQVGPSFSSELAVLLYTVKEWIDGLVIVISFMGDIVVIGECSIAASREAAKCTISPCPRHSDKQASHTETSLWG